MTRWGGEPCRSRQLTKRPTARAILAIFCQGESPDRILLIRKSAPSLAKSISPESPRVPDPTPIKPPGQA